MAKTSFCGHSFDLEDSLEECQGCPGYPYHILRTVTLHIKSAFYRHWRGILFRSPQQVESEDAGTGQQVS